MQADVHQLHHGQLKQWTFHVTREVVQETQDQVIQDLETQFLVIQDQETQVLLILDQETHVETVQRIQSQVILDQDQHQLPTQVDLAVVADQYQDLVQVVDQVQQAQHATCQMTAFQHVEM